MKLSFDEIKDWQEFENLATSYFEKISKDRNDVLEVFVEPSGTGADGGRDILVTVHVNDAFVSFKRKWVIQCKFYESEVTKTQIAKYSISDLIDEHDAVGYLLICKNGVTAPVSNQFESLRAKCRRGKNYLIWTGSQFLDKLIIQKDIVERYFPVYYKETYLSSNAEVDYEAKYRELEQKLKNQSK